MNQFTNTDYVNISDREIEKRSETPVIINHTGLLKKSIFNNELKFGKESSDLFRLCVKNNEYVYARANDMVIIESCDHLVKVYLAFGNTIKKTIRKNTLKDFLLLLPENHFIRIGRFCAINTRRLSGGNCKNQTFEFDFSLSVKLSHPISNTVFNNIGK